MENIETTEETKKRARFEISFIDFEMGIMRKIVSNDENDTFIISCKDSLIGKKTKNVEQVSYKGNPELLIKYREEFEKEVYKVYMKKQQELFESIYGKKKDKD